jgi:hypothetical protein
MGINELGDLPELKELGSILEERERAQMEMADADVDPAVAGEAADAGASDPETPVEAGTPEGAP